MGILLLILLIVAVIAVCKLFETAEQKIERRRQVAKKMDFYNLGVALVRIRGNNDGFRAGEIAAKTQSEKAQSETHGEFWVTKLWIWYRESVVYSGAGASGAQHTSTYIPGEWESVFLHLAHQAKHEDEMTRRKDEMTRRNEEAQRKRDELAADKKRFGL